MEDITGNRYGRWTVTGPAPKRGKHIMWACRCECGTEKPVLGFTLKNATSRDCGCGRLQTVTRNSTKHGMHKHPSYKSWRCMLNRCRLPTDPNFQLYGGRGIEVCLRWLGFEEFWSDMGPTWSPGSSLDRIDVNGNYEPSNCRWASRREQANNRRDNVVIPTPRGLMTVCQAAEAFGIKHQTIAARIRYGWPEASLLEPVRKRREE